MNIHYDRLKREAAKCHQNDLSHFGKKSVCFCLLFVISVIEHLICRLIRSLNFCFGDKQLCLLSHLICSLLVCHSLEECVLHWQSVILCTREEGNSSRDNCISTASLFQLSQQLQRHTWDHTILLQKSKSNEHRHARTFKKKAIDHQEHPVHLCLNSFESLSLMMTQEMNPKSRDEMRESKHGDKEDPRMYC